MYRTGAFAKYSLLGMNMRQYAELKYSKHDINWDDPKFKFNFKFEMTLFIR
jgi:hypothetical protein